MKDRLHTLAQFEKYIVDQQNAYIHIGDSCRHDDEKIAALTHPLVQSGGQYKEVPFSLCQ